MNWPFWSLSRPSSTETCGSIDPLLSLYADGMASPEEARRVDSHLPGCDTCRESLAWIRATQQTLAARPIMTPPANLHSRIAFAIAASSAAPSLRPVRSFNLRPSSYAAAATLAIFGLVGYSLWHTPPPVAVVHPSHPVRTATAAVPAVKTRAKLNGLHPVLKIHTRPVVANNAPPATPHVVVPSHPESAPVPVSHTQFAFHLPVFSVPSTYLNVPVVKVHLHTAPPPTQMASQRHSPQGTHLLAPAVKTLTPKPPEPQKVANNLPPVKVHIMPPTVTGDPAVKTASVSDLPAAKPADTILGPVRVHIGQMQSVSYQVPRQSFQGAVNEMHALDTEHFAYLDAIHGK